MPKTFGFSTISHLEAVLWRVNNKEGGCDWSRRERVEGGFGWSRRERVKEERWADRPG